MTASLVVKNLSTGYKDFSIKQINFSLENGTIFGLLGRSGSGKSTIIKSLLGLGERRTGSITYTKENTEQPLLRNVGYSPQKNALYPFLSVQENMETFAQLYGTPDKQRIEALLRRLGIYTHRNKRITQLSGGMEKRADLACTLVHNPDILVLDEPFTGLDISLQGFIWKLLKGLAEKGKIVIISSHLLDDLQRNCTSFGLVEGRKWYDNESIRNALGHDISLQAFISKLAEEEK